MPGREQNRTVYSTEFGRFCPDCGLPQEKCTCKTKGKSKISSARQDGIIRVRLERKGRGGKSVTVVEGLPQQVDLLKNTTTELKKTCGSGGALKNGMIEIQGDVREIVANYLRKKGYPVKIAGG